MPYSPTTWVNNVPPPLSAANLNKLTEELRQQAIELAIGNSLPVWVDGADPALTDPLPLNEMERVAGLAASALGATYSPTSWELGWTPARSATNFNKLEQIAYSNRVALDAQNILSPEAVRWYSDDSSFNKLIPSDPSIHPNNVNFIAKMLSLGNPTGPGLSSVPAIGFADASTPLVTVQVNWPTCNVRQVQVPIPAGFVVESQYESGASIFVEGGVEWDFYKITPPGVATLGSSGGPAAGACTSPVNWGCNIAAEHVPGVGSGGWTGPGYGDYSNRASGTYNGAGTIRIERDWKGTPVGGHWDHALAMSYVHCSNGAVWPNYVAPATSSDGPDGDIYALPEGARWQLNPSLDVTRMNTDGSFVSSGQGNLEEWKKQLLRTLQLYGAYIVDHSGGSGAGGVIMEYAYTGPAFGGTLRITGYNGYTGGAMTNALPDSLLGELRILDWNDPDNY